MSNFDPIAVATLTKAVDFLFDQAGKIMKERREARKNRGEEEDVISESKNVEPEKEEVKQWKPKEVYLDDIRQEIENCLYQIHQHRINRRDLEKQISAYGGVIFAPIILRNQLRITEDEIKKWCQQLKGIVEEIYGRKITIPGLD